MTDETGAIVRRTAVMSVGTALSRITGLLRVIAIAWALGVSSLSDAYNVANTTPNIVYDLVLGGILSAVFVPVFVEWLETRSRDEAWQSARAIMTFAVLLLSMIAVLVMVLSDVVIRVYTLGRPGPDVAAGEPTATAPRSRRSPRRSAWRRRDSGRRPARPPPGSRPPGRAGA